MNPNPAQKVSDEKCVRANCVSSSSREQMMAWIGEIADQTDDRTSTAHAQLILSGIGTNQTARRLLFLLASFRAGETARVPLDKAFALADMPRKRFNILLGALRANGALLPDPSVMGNDDEMEHLLATIATRRVREADWGHRAVALIEMRWRECIGEIVNPAVIALLQSEGDS